MDTLRAVFLVDDKLDLYMGARCEGCLEVHHVKVIGRADRHGIRFGTFEEMFDIVEDVRDFETRGERPRLRHIVVANGYQLELIQTRKRRQMRHLSDGTRTNHPDTHRTRH